MPFTCLNALAAVWLFTTPLLWPELPARGMLGAFAGAAAVFLGVMGIASRRARSALVALGLGLGLVNFVLPGGIGVMASFITSALALMAGGLSPMPQVVRPTAVAEAPAPEAMVPAQVPAAA
jgi:hypothetical protein